MSMLIDRVFPSTVRQRDSLPARLIAEARARQLGAEAVDALLMQLPHSLASAGAFLDEMTGLWRYEFGLPYQLGENLIWGTHMWLPVRELLNNLICVVQRVPEPKRDSYLRRLGDPSKHPQTLVEMAPVQRVNRQHSLDFEVVGLGNGNRAVDWVIGTEEGRMVLCEVKKRTKDFLIQFQGIGCAAQAPEPNHDPALLFQSVEHKFNSNDPDRYLQGAWIFTDLAQNEVQLQKAFEALDDSKVHFAVLGDWMPDAHVIIRRASDRPYLKKLFGLVDSNRFVFVPSRPS